MRNFLTSLLIITAGVLIYLLDTLLLQNSILITEIRKTQKELMVNEAAMSDLSDVMDKALFWSYADPSRRRN